MSVPGAQMQAPATSGDTGVASDGMDVELALSSEEESEEIEQQKLRQAQILDDLGRSLEGLKDIAVQARHEVEQRWLLDLQQYHSASGKGLLNKDGPATEEYRKTSDNITRPKVMLVASRLGDMLFPTNEPNWDLEHSPDPQMPSGSFAITDAEGAPLTPAMIASNKIAAAKSAAAAMRTAVADNLGEANYSAHGRNAIFDAVLYGSGVVKGPFAKYRKRITWGGDAGNQLVYTQEPGPDVTHVDLWNFFPQPSRNMNECEHTFELHMMPPMRLRQLGKQPGFSGHQINRLLGLTPSLGSLASGAFTERRSAMPEKVGTTVNLDGRFPVWEFHGPIPKEALISFISALAADGGVPAEAMQAIIENLQKDELNQVDAEVWMSQGIVLRAMLRQTDECGRLDYYVYNYEKDPDDIFGYGVPYLCRDDQEAVKMVWHAMMLNTMMSAGPQIGVRKGMLEPTNGNSYDFSCTRPRVWVMTEDAQDIKEAISVFNIPNVVGRMLPVYQQIKANADEHTMMPAVAQGEATKGVPTTGGMAMLMNAANVVMRRLAKQWDDDITLPLIDAHVSWNLRHNQNKAIRGDFATVPKGASHLLIKDVQAQHIQFATQLFTSNPLLQPYMKPGPWARANIDILELNGQDMLFTDDEVKANQEAQAEQPDPEVLKAQALQAQAEAAQMRAQAEARAKDADIEFRKWDRQLDNEERMVELQVRERTMAQQLQAGRYTYLHKLAALDSQERIAMSKIASDMDMEKEDQLLRRYEIDFKGSLKATEMVHNENKTAAEIAVESPSPRLA